MSGFSDNLLGAARRNGHTNGAGARFPLAICGIGLRHAGGVRSTEDFWDLLVAGRTRVSSPSSGSRHDEAHDVYRETSGEVRFEVTTAEESGDSMDDMCFSFERVDWDKADASQQTLVEVAREALEDAGEVAYRGRDAAVGCYAGVSEYSSIRLSGILSDNPSPTNGQSAAREALSVVDRVSHEHGLRGSR